MAQTVGPFDIDLFASRLNHKMRPYCSWVREPQCSHADAFTLHWSTYTNAYVFAPFSLLSRIMSKVYHENATITAVVPYFPQQSWFSQMLHLLVQAPILLPHTPPVFLTWDPTRSHPLQHSLKLLCVTLSGDITKQEEFRAQLLRRSSMPWAKVLSGSMPPNSRNTHFFVLKGKLIPLNPLVQIC